ncbi:hemin uptake protein HemP [Ramlibacter sp. MMS24-I3-19]|uniref:hemin uptake protein HemP n=1 Tax=Ramlibacter sp. MMS24-I3-19 TaxID=3416606 RepID=UPI003D006510
MRHGTEAAVTNPDADHEAQQAADPDGQAACERPQSLPPVRSEQLLQGRRVVEITHNGETYRLQATRLGKLILTK